MAEQNKAPAAAAAAPAEGQAAAPAKKGLPIKTIGILAAVLLIEAGVISAAFLFAGRPAEVKASGAVEDKTAELNELVEKSVIADKFQNTRTGRTYIYDTDIYILVRRKDEEKVDERLKAISAQIVGDIGQLFRKAEPAYLLEPSLATLIRQIKATLDQRMGLDAEGKSLIQDVVIKKYTQYRADL
ncbi:MAG: hypothetical protein NTW19_07500 [Planctomycetota bacterium]|nr:hypothetical protein [Planctomycetota bacterium]